MDKRNTYKSLIFVLITLASGWIGVLVDSVLTEQPEGNTLGMGLWLILPFLTGIILRIVSHDWKDIGVRLHFKDNMKWYLLSLIIYPIVTVITVSIAKILGYVEMTGMHSFFSIAAVSVMGGLIKNIFEEFAWRGYLTPKLIKHGLNDWLIYIISGLVWALWHAAYYIVFLPDSYFESTSRINTLLIGCILMVCWAIMYVEIYRITKSVWPCVLMHAVEDAFPNVLVMTGGFVTFTKAGDIWLNPITGIITTVLLVGIGLLLRSIRIKSDENHSDFDISYIDQ